ncbi:hypothetical protein AA313_de0201849 [Arthrobotrys entomopaga]|nr:hypothetical protein AA313_de0201849 [Arthrobotrys entomopaga]
MFKLLLSRGLVKLESLNIYQDNPTPGPYDYSLDWRHTVGTQLLLAALKENYTEIAEFLIENCVAFQNSRTFQEVLEEMSVPAVKLWIKKNLSRKPDAIKKNANMNTSWKPTFTPLHPHSISASNGVAPTARATKTRSIKESVEFVKQHRDLKPIYVAE